MEDIHRSRARLTGDYQDRSFDLVFKAKVEPSGKTLAQAIADFRAEPQRATLIAKSQLWSLALEMLASVAFVCGLGRVSTRILAMLALLAAAIVVRIALGLDTLDFGSVPSSIAYGPARIAAPFLLGMLVQRGTVEPNRLGWLTLPALIGLPLWPEKDVALQIVAVTLLFPAIVMIATGTSVPKGEIE